MDNPLKHVDSSARAQTIFALAVALALVGLYLLFNRPDTDGVSVILTITFLAWIGLVLVGLLVLMLILFCDVLASAFQKLFGGGDGNGFNPKGIFDHVRNHLIAGALLYSGLSLWGSQYSYVGAFGTTLFLLSLVFFALNVMHGKRAISSFLDKEAETAQLSGWRHWLWKRGWPKIPVYFLLPILAATGSLQAYNLYQGSDRAEVMLKLLCQDQQVSPFVRDEYCR